MDSLNYPMISVIIPIFNMEKYLRRCVESVRKQTYTNIEIILVDDGSTDRSLLICEKYTQIDARIRVIHQKNQGPSAAKNAGIDACKGYAILFVDSDDFIREDACEVLMGDMMNNQADLCICDVISGHGSTFPYHDDLDVDPNPDVYDGEKRFTNLFNENKNLSVMVCNRLFKRSIFDDIRYPEGKFHEDEYVAHHIFDKAQRITIRKTALYYYYKRPGSTMQSPFSLQRLDCVGALEDRIRFFDRLGNQELLDLCYIDFLKRFQYYYYGIKKYYPERKKLYISLYRKYDKYYKRVRERLSIAHRMRFSLFLYFPTLNYYLKKIMGAQPV